MQSKHFTIKPAVFFHNKRHTHHIATVLCVCLCVCKQKQVTLRPVFVFFRPNIQKVRVTPSLVSALKYVTYFVDQMCSHGAVHML